MQYGRQRLRTKTARREGDEKLKPLQENGKKKLRKFQL